MPHRDGHAAALARADALEKELAELKAMGVPTKAEAQAEAEPGATDLDSVNQRFAETILRAVVERPEDWVYRQGFWTLELGKDPREKVGIKILVVKIMRVSWWRSDLVTIEHGYTDPKKWNTIHFFKGSNPVNLVGYYATRVIKALKTLPGRKARLVAEQAAK